VLLLFFTVSLTADNSTEVPARKQVSRAVSTRAVSRILCWPKNTSALQCQYFYFTADSPMSPSKTATLNLRIDPRIKEAARIAALREHRSVANLIEVLIRKHCEASGISIPEQHALFGESDDE
jgi:hypothetical protein